MGCAALGNLCVRKKQGEASNLSVWTVYGGCRCTDGIRIQASVRGERVDRRLWFSVYGKTDAGYG